MGIVHLIMCWFLSAAFGIGGVLLSGFQSCMVGRISIGCVGFMGNP